METGALLLLFAAFAVQGSLSQRNLPKLQISLDQPTGVYLETENVTLTCTVETHCSNKTFGIYKDGQYFKIHPVSTRDNSARFSFAALNQGGGYRCNYWCRGDRPGSLLSEAVTVTIAEQLRKPRISLSEPTGVYVVGETVTITCTAFGDNRDKTFHFYKGVQRLTSSGIDTKDNIGTFRNTGRSSEGPYQCQYEISIRNRQLISPMSESVTVTTADPLTAPVVSLDQQSGVYIVGEKVTITCTVTGDYHYRNFYFYKDNNPLHSSPISTRDKSVTYTATGVNIRGDYKCRYGYSIKGRWLESEFSNVVTPTFAVLNKPHFWVDSDVAALGGDVTFNCSSPRDNPAIAFYLYRQGEMELVSVKSPAADTHSVTFTSKNIDHSKIGTYTCRYEADVNGRNLISGDSDPVNITVRVLNKPHFWVDSDVAALGGDVTFYCSSPRDNPAIAFYFYRQGEMELVSVKSPAADTHSVTFTSKNIDHSGIGNYTCRYEADVNGTRLSSHDSDPVNITVRASYSIPIRLAVAVLVTFGIVIILGMEFIRTEGKKDSAGAHADGVHCVVSGHEETSV
ncbi:Fc receptor-like protein 5 [Mustelus asterias]